MQQGRVLTDDDFNEDARLRYEDQRRTRVHIIGESGSPDNGFLISDLTSTRSVLDFQIGAGSLYVGGLGLHMDVAERYRTQRDWLQQPAPNSANEELPLPPQGVSRYDLVWVEAWEQGVSAVEDNELFEVALAGPDTSARNRTMRRIHVKHDVKSSTCRDAWNELVADLNRFGTITPGELELKPNCLLRVTYGGGGTTDSLCQPSVVGGYLGSMNQAIRVKIVSFDPATNTGTFIWGFDNAEPLYRVEIISESGSRRVIKMLTEPKDSAHWPLSNQIIEILPWSAVLPNRVLANGALKDCEKLAELSGHLGVINTPYNPDTKTFKLDPADTIPQGFGEDWVQRNDKEQIGEPNELYLRVWNQGVSPAQIQKTFAFTPRQPVSLGTTGLLVTFNGNQFIPDDFWIIAARPDSAGQVVPWQLDVDTGRAPHGYRRFCAPLAVIRWIRDRANGTIAGKVVSDCRRRFLPLTKIQSCCTFVVGDGEQSSGHFSKIQDAIDMLPPEGGEVCVLPGTYKENVFLKDKSKIAIHGCGHRSRLVSPSPNLGSAAIAAIRIENSDSIVIESMALIANESAPGIQVMNSKSDHLPETPRVVVLSDLDIIAGPFSAIEIQSGKEITVFNCRIRMKDSPGPWPALFSAAEDVLIERNTIKVVRTQLPVKGKAADYTGRGGIQVGGGSNQVRMENNLIQGGIGNGITLGSLEEVVGEKKVRRISGWVVDAFDPCSPCLPGDGYVKPPTDGNAGQPTYHSAGPLCDVLIDNNKILDMGLNGIGVVAFFNLKKFDELISVDNLLIRGNEIRGCLKRPIATIDADMFDAMGYGGIALADVYNLVIQHNIIEGNGPDHLDPICGVFVLHGEGIEISDNRIVENGAKTNQPSSKAKDGRRGGINIVLGVTPTIPEHVQTPSRRRFYPTQSGCPALKIHDNIVNQPMGQALSLSALGPVSIANNQFTSQGGVFRLKPLSSSFFAATALILDLGHSKELFPQIKDFSAVLKDTAKWKAKQKETLLREDTSNRAIERYLVNGNIFFSDNMCILDLNEKDVGFALSSIMVLSLDDIAFNNNQCDCSLLDDYIIVQSILFGFSLRVIANRFKEGLRDARYSALTLGLMNDTADNQSTHCLLVLDPSTELLVNRDNKVLVELILGIWQGSRKLFPYWVCDNDKTQLLKAGLRLGEFNARTKQ